jgi:prolyl-tRNA synthetase
LEIEDNSFMRMSALVGRRYKERPAEAQLDSHAFLLRGAYARQVANGIYSLLPPGLKVARKIEQIIREEMDRVGGQEVLMPVVLPRELWEESGRYGAVGAELLRFTDRTGHDMLLAMTHEEGVVQLARYEVNTYKQFPFMLYQIQTKFRDEPRSRGGLIRVREFTMKDGYSFHTTPADLEEYYRRCSVAYKRIFARAGIPEVAVVQSDTGMMGGKVAHEFMLLCDAGEDTVFKCANCDYLANADVAVGRVQEFPEPMRELQKVHTPAMKSIEEVAAFLKVETRRTAKVVFYESDSEGRPVMAILRGDLAVNEAKLARLLLKQPALAEEATIRKTGAVPGFASTLGVSGCRIIADASAAESNNLVCGANEADYHFLNWNLKRDAKGCETADIATAREGDGCPHCAGKLSAKRGIEVGNIFQLGDKYTRAMGLRYLDANGKEQTPIMGCYGIGVGRLLASVMEARHDEFGPIWPISIAPWQAHLCVMDIKKENVARTAEQLYAGLQAAGIAVIMDDRGERAGIQFAEADLLGVPLRLIVSERNFAAGQVEWKLRGTAEKGTVPITEAVEFAKKLCADKLNDINRVADAITEPF